MIIKKGRLVKLFYDNPTLLYFSQVNGSIESVIIFHSMLNWVITNIGSTGKTNRTKHLRQRLSWSNLDPMILMSSCCKWIHGMIIAFGQRHRSVIYILVASPICSDLCRRKAIQTRRRQWRKNKQNSFLRLKNYSQSSHKVPFKPCPTLTNFSTFVVNKYCLL